VPRPLKVALEEEATVAKRRSSLGLRELVALLQLARVACDAHALAAAARAGLDHDGVPDVARHLRCVLERRHLACDRHRW